MKLSKNLIGRTIQIAIIKSLSLPAKFRRSLDTESVSIRVISLLI